MALIRHRSRHLRATLYDLVVVELGLLGWTSAPVNFGADPVAVIDYQPDERGETVTRNTVAVSFGDVVNDVDEELGGGLRSAWYPVFLDVYASSLALTEAICDDLRDVFADRYIPLVDHATGLQSGERIDVEEVLGPETPNIGNGSIELFKRHWRIMKLGCRMYYMP